MTLSFGLIKPSFSYDDTGNLLVNSTQIFLKAKLTLVTAGTAKKIVMNMYDLDTTSYCEIMGGGAGAETISATWEFQGKPNFKQLNCTVFSNGNDNRAFWLEGSNNNSDWTQIDIITNSSVDRAVGMTGTDVHFKYIRIRCVTQGGSAGINIAGIGGST